MTDKSGLETDEKEIIIAALKCLHQLKYIANVAIEMKEQNVMLKQLVEEIVKVRANMDREEQ